jgi:hypothetical protein
MHAIFLHTENYDESYLEEIIQVWTQRTVRRMTRSLTFRKLYTSVVEDKMYSYLEQHSGLVAEWWVFR